MKVLWSKNAELEIVMKCCDLKKPNHKQAKSCQSHRQNLDCYNQNRKKMMHKIIEIVNTGWLTHLIPQQFLQLKGILLVVC